MILAWFALAHGADGMDGLILPGASPLDARVSVGAYAAAVGVLFAGSVATVGGEASLGISDQVALIGFGGIPMDNGVLTPAYHLASVRWLAYSKDGFHFAPLLTQALVYQRPLVGSLGIGAAIEGGNDRVRADLSIPTLVGVRAGLRNNDYGLFLALPASTGFEAGITALIGDAYHLRVGIPAITWGVRTEQVYFELSGSFLIIAAGVSAKLGARF